MKLISFNCAIEVSRNQSGYSNHVYIDVNAGNVHITNPYINLDAETAAFITKLEHDFINHSIDFNTRIDGFNRDMGLEEYAPQPPIFMNTEEKSTEVLTESLAELASVQPERGGSVTTDSCPEVSTESEEALEARETGSDIS